MKKLPIQIKIIIAFVAVLIVYSVIKGTYTKGVNFFNTAKNYELEYAQLERDQITTFDNNYLIFKDKSNITELSKETFITVTQIIFENRADGQNVAWKWLQENQPVDYKEFTKFYSDLSAFTRERYEENNGIERKKQQITKLQNQLLVTFPGVLYNYFFHFKMLTYKEGFITEETRILFKRVD